MEVARTPQREEMRILYFNFMALKLVEKGFRAQETCGVKI
jgi:hypothetical protein